MVMYKKIYIKPNNVQRSQLIHFSDTNRYVHNAMFTLRQSVYNATKKNTSVSACIQFIRDMNHSWVQDCPDTIISRNAEILEEQYKRFFRERTIKSHPDLWKKSLCKPMFSLGYSDIRQIDSKHLAIQKLTGYLKTNSFVLPANASEIHITNDGKNWYLVFSYEVRKHAAIPDKKRVGIDLGLSCYATLSDLSWFEGIWQTPTVLKLKAQIDGLSVAIAHRLKYNGNRETKGVLELRHTLAMYKRRLHNITVNFIHQLTHDLAKTTQGSIVIEDLDIPAMMRNKDLAESIREREFDRFRRYLDYKCKLAGVTLIVADRFYPSSKLCSTCGYLKSAMPLSQRIYECPSCGNRIGRDTNAAVNLQYYTPDWRDKIHG